MVGGDGDRGRGRERGRERGRNPGRGRSYEPRGGYGNYQQQPRRSSSQDSGSSSSSSSHDPSRDDRRLQREYRPPPPSNYSGIVPTWKGKSKAKPQRKQSEDHADAAGLQSTPSPLNSKEVSRSPSPGSKEVSRSPSPGSKEVSRSPSPGSKEVSRSPSPGSKEVSRSPSPGSKEVSRSPSPGSKQVSRTPSPVSSTPVIIKQVSRTSSSSSSAGELFPDSFPPLQRSNARSQGPKTALTRDVSSQHSEQETSPQSIDPQNQAPPPDEGTTLKDKFRDQAPPPDEDTALKEKFRELLNNYGSTAEGDVSFYQALGEFNSKIKREMLKIHFNHLLNRQYIRLALKIKEKSARDKQHLWLQSIVSEFLNTWFKYKTNKEKQRLRFEFIMEPKFIDPLSVFTTGVVVEKQPIYGGLYDIVRTTKVGRLVYLSVRNHVLEIHKGGQSLKGKFKEKNIYILSYHGKGRLRTLILSKRFENFENDFDDRILDLKGVNLVLSPRYALDGVLPVFFSNLKADLEGLTRSKLKDSGILTVLPRHYSLNTPAAWGFLLWKVHLVIQQFKSSGINFSDVFGEGVNLSVFEDSDWRPGFLASADDVIKGVYGHDNKGNNKFTNDLQGMTDCDRHLVQHAHHHPKSNPVRVKKNDDSELFAVSKMPLVIPSIIDGLFKTKEMKFKEQLGPVFDDFCKLCYDPDDFDLDEGYYLDEAIFNDYADLGEDVAEDEENEDTLVVAD